MGTSFDAPTVWARRSYVLARFSLPYRQLTALVKRGQVRAAKLGRHQQSRLLFHVGDVESALEAQAEGHAPQVQESGTGVDARGDE